MDINSVLIAHIHFDHVGGNLDENSNPTFPNMHYPVSGTEYELWLIEPDFSPLQVLDNGKETIITFAEKHVRPLTTPSIVFPIRIGKSRPEINQFVRLDTLPITLLPRPTQEGRALLYFVGPVFFSVQLKHPS